MNPAVLGVMIPILAIILGVATAITAIIAGHRQRALRAELRHRERLAAIEKGIEIPNDPVEYSMPPMPRPRHLLRGLIWFFVGAVLTVAMWQTAGDVPYLFGLIPAAVGLAYLIYYFVEGRHEPELTPGSAPPAPPAGD